MINEIFERELQNTSINDVSLADYVKENYKPIKPKTGHWIGDNQAFYIYAKCSECGSVHDTATNYCPNCGCLMDRTEFDEYVKTEGA